MLRQQIETARDSWPREYGAYYNTRRPHRSLEQRPPPEEDTRPGVWPRVPFSSRDRLRGLLHEYDLAA